MRGTLLAPFMLVFLLLACQMTAPGGGGQGISEDAISVTSLDQPAAAERPAGDVPAASTTAAPHPKPRPQDLAASPEPAVSAPDEPIPTSLETGRSMPEASEPEVPRTAEQLLCENAKGQWVAAGESGAFYCASLTRDGGKQCNRKSQCQGECLARSGTCSPITPLYGCNDVMDKDRRKVTLCID